MKVMVLFLINSVVILSMGCNSPNVTDTVTDTSEYAVVEKVTVSGNEGSYTFSVTLKSPDTGCQQYANWWEVVSEDGALIYRRILGHSHVNEQPFTRSGGNVSIAADEVVIVRGHMNTSGYGEEVMKGSASSDFQKVILDKNFANALEAADPQPGDCAF